MSYSSLATAIAKLMPNSTGKLHTLKTWPEYYQAVNDGSKTFELRLNDRDFVVGDLLGLREYDPSQKRFPHRNPILRRRVTHMMRLKDYEAKGWRWRLARLIMPDLVVMSIKDVDEVPTPDDTGYLKKSVMPVGSASTEIRLTRMYIDREISSSESPPEPLPGGIDAE